MGDSLRLEAAAFLLTPAGRAAVDARFVAVVACVESLTGRGGLNAGPFRFGGFDAFGGISREVWWSSVRVCGFVVGKF